MPEQQHGQVRDDAHVEAEVLRLEKRHDELAQEFADETLGAQAYRLASQKLTERLEDSRLQLREVRSRQRRRVKVALNPVQLRESWSGLSPRERRAIAGAFIAQVRVLPAVRGRNIFDPSRLHVEWL